jgi:hypothetical protein
VSSPLEDLPNHVGLFKDDPVVGRTTTSVLAHKAVTVGRRRQHTHVSSACRMSLAAAATFHNLRSLVFGDHALHLQQQVFFGTRTDRAIQKRQLNTVALQFFDKQHLPGVSARQPIWGVNIQPLKAAGPGDIAETSSAGRINVLPVYPSSTKHNSSSNVRPSARTRSLMAST